MEFGWRRRISVEISVKFFSSSNPHLETLDVSPNMTGYQKVAQLMAKHGEVAMLKRFDFMNNLNLLYLQAELIHLDQDMKNHLNSGLQPTKWKAEESHETQHCADSTSALCCIQNAGSVPQSTSGLSDATTNASGTATIDSQASSLEHVAQVSNSDCSDRISQSRVSQPPGTGSTTIATSSIPPPDPARDWWDIVNAEEDSDAADAWKTMLEARAKLKEYSLATLLLTSYTSNTCSRRSDIPPDATPLCSSPEQNRYEFSSAMV